MKELKQLLKNNTKQYTMGVGINRNHYLISNSYRRYSVKTAKRLQFDTAKRLCRHPCYRHDDLYSDRGQC
jgi:hypothetical protein